MCTYTIISELYPHQYMYCFTSFYVYVHCCCSFILAEFCTTAHGSEFCTNGATKSNHVIRPMNNHHPGTLTTTRPSWCPSIVVVSEKLTNFHPSIHFSSPYKAIFWQGYTRISLSIRIATQTAWSPLHRAPVGSHRCSEDRRNVAPGESCHGIYGQHNMKI